MVLGTIMILFHGLLFLGVGGHMRVCVSGASSPTGLSGTSGSLSRGARLFTRSLAKRRRRGPSSQPRHHQHHHHRRRRHRPHQSPLHLRRRRRRQHPLSPTSLPFRILRNASGRALPAEQWFGTFKKHTHTHIFAVLSVLIIFLRALS